MIKKILLSRYWDIFPLLAIPLAIVDGGLISWLGFVIWAATITIRYIDQEMK